APVGAHAEATLRREEDPVALAADPLARELLAPALAVDVRRVDEVHARVDRAVEHAPRLVVGRRDALHERLRLAEGHRPEAHHADAEPAPSKLSKFHLAPRSRRRAGRVPLKRRPEPPP